MVYRILRNSVYGGQAYAWRYKRANRYAELARPQSEWIKVSPATPPPIVSEAVYLAAQERLDRGTADATRNESRPYYLRDFIYCSILWFDLRQASPVVPGARRPVVSVLVA
jgi:hypothetical protein